VIDPLIVTQAINVLYGVSTLAVLALGLAVIFGLLGVLNIAHGEFVMIGAYCAYVTQAGGLPYLAAVPLTLAVCAILGVAVE
jgi:branched-chain amino acid transport system permease protein/urea transport system permease protein